MSDRKKRLIIEMNADGWGAEVISMGEFDAVTDKQQKLDQEGLLLMVADLDRCEHGRHAGDSCFDCKGPSHGNPHLIRGGVIGYDLTGRPYILPRNRSKSHIEDWRP
jgi:hypothetical protein